MVKEEVVEETKVNYDDVQIIDKAFPCIYAPKWVINIESQNRIYAREILAGSSTILMDEIAYCPKDFSNYIFLCICFFSILRDARL
jgi:hypothetical protein